VTSWAPPRVGVAGKTIQKLVSYIYVKPSKYLVFT